MLLGERGRIAGREAVVLKKLQKCKEECGFFRNFAGQKGNGDDKYEEDIVCVSREYLPESDGGVCDEGFGG